MKDQPRIAPEIRGLLEEIAADPRSDLRLVPRKPLRAWFERGESAPTSAIATTRAERHLVEEHRESLAALLCEAAWLAYWKAPVLAHRPVDAEGKLYDPAEREPRWRARGERFGRTRSINEGTDLLRGVLGRLDAGNAHALAVASLQLVPSDRTRCYVALTIPWDRPRSAAHFFRRLSQTAWPIPLRSQALESLGARLCSLGLYYQAREAYRAVPDATPRSPYGLVCSTTLSCLLGDPRALTVESRRLDAVARSMDEPMQEELALLRTWADTLPASLRTVARNTREQVSGELSELGQAITEVFGT
ncbi:MAG TPA: hypothetical protein VF530_07580 [Planctomycetota bacterium]